MSKICFLIIKDQFLDDEKRMLSGLKTFVKKHGFGAFFYKGNDIEPQLKIDCDSIVISFADDFLYDNCERFLLLDTFCYNGKNNSIPFAKRMKLLQESVCFLASFSCKLELFLGLSGTLYEEYQHVSCTLDDFYDTICEYYPCVSMGFYEPDLHIMIE